MTESTEKNSDVIGGLTRAYTKRELAEQNFSFKLELAEAAEKLDGLARDLESTKTDLEGARSTLLEGQQAVNTLLSLKEYRHPAPLPEVTGYTVIVENSMEGIDLTPVQFADALKGLLNTLQATDKSGTSPLLGTRRW